MKEKSYGRRKADENLKYASVLLLLLILFAVFIGLYISVMFGTRDAIMICSGIIIGTCFYYIVETVLQKRFLPRYGKYKGFIQGEVGETAVHQALIKNLGKGNLVIHDAVLEENIGNIDHIIIGQYGIFVIETKTHRGKIICKGDDWFQDRKIGDNINRIMLKQSPSKQARSNAKRLRYFLEQYYPNYPKISKQWIWAMVVFPNKQHEEHQIERQNEPPECKVFESIDSMLEEIKKGKKLELTEDDLSELKNIFMESAEVEDINIMN